MHKTTKIERESLLSAHLDGELSPKERQEAEAAVAADPIAADEFRSLAGVRDLIAGLSRPTGPDLAPGVMERLKNRRLESRRDRSTARRPRIGALVGGVAASIACLVLFGDRPQPPRPELPNITSAAPAPPPTNIEIVGPPAPIRPESPAGETLVGPPAELALAGRPTADSSAAEPARPILPELLADADPLVFSVADLDETSTREQVAALLGLSSHRDFHQIELPPADSNGDAEAATSPTRATVVFAATLDPKELATFRERLATAFPEGLEEGGPAPTLTAELMGDARVTTLPANPAGDVSFPQTKLAIQFRTGERRNWPALPRDADRPDVDARPDQEADAPVADAESPRADAPEPADAGQPRSILVWIVDTPMD